ncbi:hypothetical protein [Streptomyces sp. P9-A2]|uniref:hypothetical protein n=1 Tax=Streptomyces sp. P9-A2 TaxID=3072284 RepID=UPI003FCEBB87
MRSSRSAATLLQFPSNHKRACPAARTGRTNALATTDVFRHHVPAESDFGYAQAIRSGDLIHVPGQFSLGREGRVPSRR